MKNVLKISLTLICLYVFLAKIYAIVFSLVKRISDWPVLLVDVVVLCACVLLVLFLWDGSLHISALFTGSEGLSEQADFFARFYTLLIFADIFLLLASEGVTHNAIMLFRNSGYAAGALFMRMALGAPHFWDAGLGVFAALYIIAVSYAVKHLQLKK